ncbi:hypothetical protein DMC30DRAFT_449603 [Rhodotorula diobovata]|uniref:Uncharacterized protein n=1 Tax=Rhodotorula diobovata TaxID=5288 RepID=A0A5C5FMS7_9BASI|nr:hypothetical protein DMC30DRAFT_449603 [Rhodotorula diobovata]
MQLGVTSKSTSGCPPTDNHNQPPPRRGSAPDRPACSWCTTGKTTPAGSAARPRSPASVQSVGDFVASPSPSCGDRSSLRPSTSCALAPPCAARAQQARTAPRNTRCHMHSEARRLELEGLESLSSTTVVELADELPILGQLDHNAYHSTLSLAFLDQLEFLQLVSPMFFELDVVKLPSDHAYYTTRTPILADLSKPYED